MIKRVGTDIIELDRINRIWQRWPDKFLHRVYTASESAYCLGKGNPLPSLGVRFAAKEALIKALGGHIWRWTEIEILMLNGRPEVRLTGRAAQVARSLGVSYATVSMAHCRNYAVAFALVE